MAENCAAKISAAGTLRSDSEIKASLNDSFVCDGSRMAQNNSPANKSDFFKIAEARCRIVLGEI